MAYAYMYENPHDMSRRRQSYDPDPPVSHTRRSWSNNGVHYTMETTSFSSPNMSFGMMGGTSRSQLFGPTQERPQAQGRSLLGTAFGLLGSVLAGQQQAAVQENARRSARQPYVKDLAYGEDEDDLQRSFFSRFSDRLTNHDQQSRRATHGRDHSPRPRRAPRAADDRRSRSHRTQERDPTWTSNRSAYVEDVTDDEDDDIYDDYEAPYGHQPRRAFTTSDMFVIEALQNAADHHRRQAKKCRERIQQTSTQLTSTSVLQRLVDELRGHEKAYESALQSLQQAKQEARNNTFQQKVPRRSRYSHHGEAPRTPQEDFFGAFPPDDFNSFFQTRRPTHPMFADFDDMNSPFESPFKGAFHHFFNDFETRSPLDDMPHFFAMPGATYSTHSQNANARHRPQQQSAAFPKFTAPRQSPPASLLRPEEAQRLFKLYNDRWNALNPADPNIPFPARRLQSTALLARESIWAPLASSPVVNWSDEFVMQANAQAFFLGVVGLTPNYAEAPGTGRVVMGFNKAQASTAQVKELVDILKKEKTRWHSDRLGRRNGGIGGPNEALQRDEKSRAVFHAVCELMETAQ